MSKKGNQLLSRIKQRCGVECNEGKFEVRKLSGKNSAQLN